MGSLTTRNMPCAACRQLRRRCTYDCIFLPYFPSHEPENFAVVHRIFGASDICKTLQMIPVDNRQDAVTSMVYEARARLRDPVYGCVSLIASLQKQVFRLEFELNAAQAEAVSLRAQLSEALSMPLLSLPGPPSLPSSDSENLFYEEPNGSLNVLWDDIVSSSINCEVSLPPSLGHEC